MTPRVQTLTRDDIVAGLRELVAALTSEQRTARIRIVGGAAIALTINADRPATVDIDAPLEPADIVLAAAGQIAARHGWRSDWINDASAVFVPTGYGTRSAVWQTVHHDGHVQIQVATPETLLAMKLHAAQRRGNRDAGDIAVLLPTCGITSTAEAADLYEAFYPGDALTARTELLVDRLLTNRTPPPPAPVVPPLG